MAKEWNKQNQNANLETLGACETNGFSTIWPALVQSGCGRFDANSDQA
jgi:hypothetical protein